jgi:CHAT domain-containing protein
LAERQKALAELRELVSLSLSRGERLEAARALSSVGRLHLTLNEPQAALDSHRQALDLLKDIFAVDLRVDNLNGLAAAYLHKQEKKLAEEALVESLTLSRQAAYTSGEAQALLTLSDLQNNSNHATALVTAQEALSLWQSLADQPGIARGHVQVGICYMAQDILVEAAQHFQQALNIWRNLNNPPEQAESLIMLGFIESRKGDWHSSISYYTQAQGLLDEEAEPAKMGKIAAGIGAAFNENGMPENGAVHYQRALNYYLRTQNPQSVTYALWALGRTYFLQGDFQKAVSYFQQSLATVDENDLWTAPNFQYLGRVYLANNEHATALQYLEPALAAYTKAANPNEAAQVRALIGQVFQQQGRLEPARQYYLHALETFRNLSDQINQAAVFYALGRLELNAGRYELAEDYLRRSVEATENIRRVPTSSDLTAAFSATVYERYEQYIECLMRRHEAQPSRGFAARAFEMSELARARSLAELLRATQTNLLPGLDENLATREKMLRQSLRAKEDQRIQLLAEEGKKKEAAELEATMARLDAEYKQVIKTIRSSHPAFEQLVRPVAWDLKRIQEQVVNDDQTVLLEYSLGADRSHVWVVTRNDFKSYELPAQKHLHGAAQKVYDLLSASPGAATDGELTSATRELGRMVLAPVAAELNKQRIIIVADAELHYIPFQVLPTADGEPLIDDHQVINAPSASILGELQQEAARRQPAPKALAAFGNPVFASNYALRRDAVGGQLAALQLPPIERWRQATRDIELTGDSFELADVQPLHYAKIELNNLRNVASWDETFLAEGFDATRGQLIGTDLTQYAILHIATHGLFDTKRPEKSGFLLSMVDRGGRAQDGFVGLQDIYSLHAPVNLVVLSACRTGLGKDVRGEGLLGLTRGFMYAGASSVVASLWKVDDEATAELMRQFYTNLLAKKMPAAEALRAAQNSIRQTPEWRSPYYWAAFTLQGEHRQIIKSSPAVNVTKLYLQATTGGVLLLMLLAGAGWGYRRCRLRAAKQRA